MHREEYKINGNGEDNEMNVSHSVIKVESSNFTNPSIESGKYSVNGT
jgi:hypothetical protein